MKPSHEGIRYRVGRMRYTQKVWKKLAAASTLSVSEENRKEVLTTTMEKQTTTRTTRQELSGTTWKNG